MAFYVALIWGMHAEGGVPIDDCVTGCASGAPVGELVVCPGNNYPVGIVEGIFSIDNEGLEGKGGLWARKKACAAAEPDDRDVVASDPALFGMCG